MQNTKDTWLMIKGKRKNEYIFIYKEKLVLKATFNRRKGKEIERDG